MSESIRGRRPEAFSIIDLGGGRDVRMCGEVEMVGGRAAYRSIMDIIGATRAAAEEALTRSAPRRSARFLVFHFAVRPVPDLGSIVAAGAGMPRGGADAVPASCEGLTASNWS